MRVVVVDPPAYTPPYDHHLAAALAHGGADVELVTSRFRFGERPTPDGYGLAETFYRHASRHRRDVIRLPLKLVEHPLAMRRTLRRPAEVIHFQWLGIPELDAGLLGRRRPLVFTAHDLVPRRTASRTRLWRHLFSRFDRIVVHSQRGRERLERFGVDEDRLRVIPHPVFPGEPSRRDDGATVLALGVIRPYKGLPDAVTAVGGVDGARLLVAGDPRIRLDELRVAAGAATEWRLGYLGPDEITRALADATIAVFPYRDELDQSGALLEALGAGVPAVVYDVGGLGEIVSAFDAGRVVAPGDVDGLREAIRALLTDTTQLERARAGALDARATLTWDASAAAHLDVYRELL